jgi:hypothetical protein
VLDRLARDERLTEPLRGLLDDYARQVLGGGEPARKTGEPAAKN